jgi:hypothetical protein
VTSTQVHYEPDASRPRLNADDARDQLNVLLAVECPRILRENRTPTGVANVAVDVDRSGAVLSSRITHKTEDDRIDAILGGVAAQMQFDPPEGMKGDHQTGRLRMGYSCAAGTAVGTIEML